MRHTTEKPECGTYTPSDTHSLHDSYLLSTMKTPGVKRIYPIESQRKNHNNQPRFFTKRTCKYLIKCVTDSIYRSYSRPRSIRGAQ